MKRIVLCIAILLSSLSLTAQINTDRVMMIGRNALYFEDYVLAIQYFNQVIASKPYLTDPYYYRGVGKFMLDDFKGAEEDCSSCLERNPYYIAAYQLRGAARQNQDKFKEAAEDYFKSLEFFPEDKITLVNMAIVNVEMKQYNEGERYFGDLLKLFPDYTPGYLSRGQMYLEKGDTVQALADYDKAIEIDPYTAQSFSARGLLYYQQNEYNKALADLDEAIRLDPFFEGNFINRGLVKYNLKDLRGAMADYDKVIELDENNYIARFNRGLLRAQVADNNLAIEDFTKVIEMEPENTIAYLNRATLNGEIGDFDGAINDLNVVLEAHPDFFTGYYMRSDWKRQLNDMRGAERDYNTARTEENNMRKRVAAGETKMASADKSNVREETDTDIDKFNLLVVADKKTEEENKYKSETRGQVQNRNANVKLEPKFVLTYYDRTFDVERPVYFLQTVEDANNGLDLTWKLRMTNNEASLNELQIQTHFRSIENYKKRMKEDADNSLLYFGRGMDHLLVQDYEKAMSDINRVIELRPDMTLAYFMRAILRSKEAEINPEQIQEINNQKSVADVTLPSRSSDFKVAPVVKVPDLSTRSLIYNAILKDYEKVISLDPDFFYAYYNRAEIYSLERDYKAAIVDYSKAIELNSRFAEAYFNRGLSRLAIGESEAGLDDLRQAGELGIVESYSIIKRMQ